MPIYKRCGRCGKRISAGTKCDCFKERHKEYDRYSRDKKSADFYSSKEWEIARLKTLTIDKGIDVYLYMTIGEVVLADAVHHIVPLKDNWSRRIDSENLISLSNDTHSMIEQMYKKDKQQIMNMLFEIVKKYRVEISG